jgi:monoamine oxidase
VWNGYFDGAVEAGERTAAEVAARLTEAPAFAPTARSG